MIQIFKTQGSFYDTILAEHAEALSNFERMGQFKTNKELNAWNGATRPMDQRMKIHYAYPTVIQIGGQIQYASQVCYELMTAEELAEEMKERE